MKGQNERKSFGLGLGSLETTDITSNRHTLYGFPYMFNTI